MTLRRVFLGLAAALLSGAAAQAADLRVTVTGLDSDDGHVHIAIWDKPETFPDGDKLMTEGVVKSTGRRAEWRFTGLKPGAYAVATFHDANDNNKFDQGLFGIPLEIYGFSNGARALLSAPAFDDAAVTVPPGGLAITIDLGHGDDNKKAAAEH